MPKKQLVAEALIDLHRRLSTLPTRSRERRIVMQETANLYGVSEQTLYRALAQRARPGSGGLPAQILIHRFVGSKIPLASSSMGFLRINLFELND